CPQSCQRGTRETPGPDPNNPPPALPSPREKTRALALFQTGKEAPDPRREMLLEQFAIGTGGSGEAAARKPRHDLAQGRRVILGLRLAGYPFDSELVETRAQARERALLQEAGEEIRSLRQKCPAPEPNEEIEIFALDALDIGALRRLCERDMR